MSGDRQLEAVVRAMAAGLAGGLNLSDALAAAAAAARPPLAEPLVRAVAAHRLGAPLPAALAALQARRAVPETDLFLRAIKVGLACGGGLPRLLAGLALVLQQRRQLRAELASRCTEARLSAAVLAAMPLLLGLYLAWVDPALLAPLWTTPGGRWVLAYAALSWLAGAALTLRLLRPPELR